MYMICKLYTLYLKRHQLFKLIYLKNIASVILYLHLFIFIIFLAWNFNQLIHLVNQHLLQISVEKGILILLLFIFLSSLFTLSLNRWFLTFLFYPLSRIKISACYIVGNLSLPFYLLQLVFYSIIAFRINKSFLFILIFTIAFISISLFLGCLRVMIVHYFYFDKKSLFSLGIAIAVFSIISFSIFHVYSNVALFYIIPLICLGCSATIVIHMSNSMYIDNYKLYDSLISSRIHTKIATNFFENWSLEVKYILRNRILRNQFLTSLVVSFIFLCLPFFLTPKEFLIFWICLFGSGYFVAMSFSNFRIGNDASSIGIWLTIPLSRTRYLDTKLQFSFGIYIGFIIINLLLYSVANHSIYLYAASFSVLLMGFQPYLTFLADILVFSPENMDASFFEMKKIKSLKLLTIPLLFIPFIFLTYFVLNNTSMNIANITIPCLFMASLGFFSLGFHKKWFFVLSDSLLRKRYSIFDALVKK